MGTSFEDEVTLFTTDSRLDFHLPGDTRDSIHMLDRISQQTREGTRQGGRRVEDSHSPHHLISLVPDGQEIGRGSCKVSANGVPPKTRIKHMVMRERRTFGRTVHTEKARLGDTKDKPSDQ